MPWSMEDLDVVDEFLNAPPLERLDVHGMDAETFEWMRKYLPKFWDSPDREMVEYALEVCRRYPQLLPGTSVLAEISNAR